MQVWDLTKSRSLEAAAALLEESAFTQNASDMALVLAAAANCSSGARHTPLHAAVEAGCKYSVKVSVLPFLALAGAHDRVQDAAWHTHNM